MGLGAVVTGIVYFVVSVQDFLQGSGRLLLLVSGGKGRAELKEEPHAAVVLCRKIITRIENVHFDTRW